MANQNKSAQARQRRRSSDGRFADEDKQDSLPSDTKIQQVASLICSCCVCGRMRL